MRFFQPLQQLGYSRILAETRTHFPLSPGLIAIEQPYETFGYAAAFALPFPPNFQDIERKTSIKLSWLLPKEKMDKYLFTEFELTEQPFYPPSVEESYVKDDFEQYLDQFLAREKQDKAIFTLPISQIDNPRIDEVMKTDCAFYTLSGLTSLFNNQRRLTETLVKLRELLSPDIALYAPGPISPSLYTFLVYMGVDFFDNSIAYYVSKNGYFLTETQTYRQSTHPKCYCPHCNNETPNLLKHNEMIVKNKIAQIRDSFERGILRAQVERDIHDDVNFAAALRRLDTHFGVNLRQRTPVRSSAPVKCIGEESFNQPLITEYRERIRERYTPDSISDLVILLPCSARKPYSFSKSHMLYHKAMRKAGKNVFKSLTELIVTSPLSVVPRELEDIYPTRYYDIPVAGEWSENEIEVTAGLLRDVLSKFPNGITIINHTHGKGYSDIVEKLRISSSLDIRDTAIDTSPTNEKSLELLTSTLTEVLEEKGELQQKSISLKIRKLQAIADFQYGLGVGETLFPYSIRIKGKYPRDLQIYNNKEHIATYVTRSSLLSIFPKPANLILNKTKNVLEFGANKVSGSNIYAPGVVKANKQILPNDEIFIVNENQVIATATALVSGIDMNKMTSGIVAEVKKKMRN